MITKLPPDVADQVKQIVATGRYQDESEVLRAAVQELVARDMRIDELRALLQQGIDQLESGDYVDVSEEFWSQIESEVADRTQLRSEM